VDALAEPPLVQLDDVRRALAVLLERPPQRTPGVAVAPEDVAVRAGEEAARQEVRLAGGEALDAIGVGGVRQAPRMIAPAEPTARHHPDLLPRLEQPQH